MTYTADMTRPVTRGPCPRTLCLLIVFLFFTGFMKVSAVEVSSRWDLTIGGSVKFEMGYTNRDRHGFGDYENVKDRYGNFRTLSTATRLNFLTRGPEAWGARTSAFMEGDFIGTYAGAGRGTFGLRHAFMSFDWPDTKLVVGHTLLKWGFLPTYSYAIISGSDLSPFVKGHRQPMIRLEHKFARNWNLSGAIMSPTNTLGSNRSSTQSGVVDGFTLSGMPFFEGSLGWSTDKLGRIGPWRALVNIDGFYGREKKIITLYTGDPDAPSSISHTDKNVDCWGVALRGFVPVIPDTKGNRTGALSLSGVVFMASNPSWLQSRAYTVGSYARPGDTATAPAQPTSDPLPGFTAPRMYGLWGQISYFLTDSLSINGWYGYLRNDTSRSFNSAASEDTGQFIHTRSVQNAAHYILSLCYDVNQAVRFGVEYSRHVTRYANYVTTADPSDPDVLVPVGSKDRTRQTFMLGAWYFF